MPAADGHARVRCGGAAQVAVLPRVHGFYAAYLLVGAPGFTSSVCLAAEEVPDGP